MVKPQNMAQSGLTLVLITLMVGPYFQGFFFSQQALGAMATIGLANLVWVIGRYTQRRDLIPIARGPSVVLLASLIWTLIVTGWSVYARGNIELCLKATSSFLVFYMFSAEASTHIRRQLVWLLGLTSAVVALLGLLEYAGFFMEHGLALANLLGIEVQRTRLFTVFQYPNTAAIFFLTVLLLNTAYLSQSSSLLEKVCLAVSSGVTATALVFTLSRGAFILAPVAFLMLWIGLSSQHVSSSILHFITTVALPAAISLNPIGRAAPIDDWPRVLLWTFGAVLVSCLGTVLLHPIQNLSSKARLAVTLTSLSILLIAAPALASKVTDRLPQVFGRIKELNAQVITSSSRVEYLRDTTKLLARRPWGYGGGSWSRLYTQVQDVNYIARDPHSHYALILVETGIPGFALFVLSVGFAAYQAFRQSREEPVRWGMIVAALTLAAHAAFDIDLSFYMIWLLLWVLLATAQPVAGSTGGKAQTRAALVVLLTLAATSVMLSGLLFEASRRYTVAELAVLKGDQETALAAGKMAIALDPLNSQFRTMIPTHENMNRALRLDPYNEQLWRFVAQLLADQGDLDGAVVAATKALQLRSMSISHYEHVASLHSHLMIVALENHDLSAAKGHALEIVELASSMESRSARSLERQQQAFSTYPALTWTSTLHLLTGQAQFVLGDTSAAEDHLTTALHNESTAEDASLWLHALYTALGESDRLMTLEPSVPEALLRSSLYARLVELYQ